MVETILSELFHEREEVSAFPFCTEPQIPHRKKGVRNDDHGTPISVLLKAIERRAAKGSMRRLYPETHLSAGCSSFKRLFTTTWELVSIGTSKQGLPTHWNLAGQTSWRAARAAIRNAGARTMRRVKRLLLAPMMPTQGEKVVMTHRQFRTDPELLALTTLLHMRQHLFGVAFRLHVLKNVRDFAVRSD